MWMLSFRINTRLCQKTKRRTSFSRVVRAKELMGLQAICLGYQSSFVLSAPHPFKSRGLPLDTFSDSALDKINLQVHDLNTGYFLHRF